MAVAESNLSLQLPSKFLSVEVRKWEDLTTDCLVEIFKRVGLKALVLDVPLVCTTWYRASLDPRCWRVLDFQDITVDSQLVKADRRHIPCVMQLIKCAVHRSSGMATKVVFPSSLFFNNIIEYVLERCSLLKSLTRTYSMFFFLGEQQKCLLKLIKKWKDLEFVSLSTHCNFSEILAEIRSHCINFVALIVILDLLDVTNCRGFDANDTEILEKWLLISRLLCQRVRKLKRTNGY